MLKFEVNKTYSAERIEIIVKKRTDKNIIFSFTSPNWWEKDTEKEFRRKIDLTSLAYEKLNLDNHWSAPAITAE